MKCNWNQYNKSLINRGNINFWFSEESLKKWKASPCKKIGRPFKFSDHAKSEAQLIVSITVAVVSLLLIGSLLVIIGALLYLLKQKTRKGDFLFQLRVLRRFLYSDSYIIYLFANCKVLQFH